MDVEEYTATIIQTASCTECSARIGEDCTDREANSFTRFVVAPHFSRVHDAGFKVVPHWSGDSAQRAYATL